ncbi:MAG: hypothetical protein ACFB0D_04850 [Phormidesmis sp.]
MLNFDNWVFTTLNHGTTTIGFGNQILAVTAGITGSQLTGADFV